MVLMGELIEGCLWQSFYDATACEHRGFLRCARPSFVMLKHNLLLSHPSSSVHTAEEQTTEQKKEQREAEKHAAGLGDDFQTRGFLGKNLVIAD